MPEPSITEAQPEPTVRTPEEIKRRNRTLMFLAVATVIAFFWSLGTFDNFLWRVGLNHSTCIQNGFGATFCGDTADRYQSQIRQLTTP